jgi:flagellar export protein FliJ
MTEKQRLKRIQRLVDLRERERDSARGELADAQRHAARAQARHESAERRWADEADAAAEPGEVASMRDFAESRMHLDSLRRVADRASEQRRRAEGEEDRKRDAATEAQRELRKMELWSEAQEDRLRELGLRADQRVTDELAARIVHRSKA